MPSLFFVCSTAVTTTRGEEPKTEPDVALRAPGLLGHGYTVPDHPQGTPLNKDTSPAPGSWGGEGHL